MSDHQKQTWAKRVWVNAIYCLWDGRCVYCRRAVRRCDCGRPANGQVFRIIQRQVMPEAQFEHWNGFLLCDECNEYDLTIGQARGIAKTVLMHTYGDLAEMINKAERDFIEKNNRNNSDYKFAEITQEQLDARGSSSWKTLGVDLPSLGGYNSIRADR